MVLLRRFQRHRLVAGLSRGEFVVSSSATLQFRSRIHGHVSFLQSKAAYVLFYQRRDLAHMVSSPSAGLSMAAENEEEEDGGGGGGVATNGAARVNGDASSVEDMDTN